MVTIPCEIKLNDPNGNGVYYAGQVVSGSVTLNLLQNLIFDYISVTVRGYSYWLVRETKSKYHYATYKGKEEFINETSPVVQSEQNGAGIELPSGEHEYKFASCLPRVSPPSLDGLYGHIRYRVIVLIKQSGKSKIKHKVQFTVLEPLNLNTCDAPIREPICFEKNYKFFLSKRHKLELKLGLARSGFAIGETMRINIDAHNHSKSDIDSIKFSLDQVILYATTRHGKPIFRSERRTKHKGKTGMLARLSHTNVDYCITIPYTPATSYASRIISVSYELIVSVSSQWTPILIPIIIGNIPVMDNKE